MILLAPFLPTSMQSQFLVAGSFRDVVNPRCLNDASQFVCVQSGLPCFHLLFIPVDFRIWTVWSFDWHYTFIPSARLSVCCCFIFSFSHITAHFLSLLQAGAFSSSFLRAFSVKMQYKEFADSYSLLRTLQSPTISYRARSHNNSVTLEPFIDLR